MRSHHFHSPPLRRVQFASCCSFALLLLLLVMLCNVMMSHIAAVTAECVMNITSFVKDRKYDKRNSPNKTGPTTILLGIYINGFNYISEQSMDYEINLYLREQWWDPRLKFNSSLLCGMDFMKLPDHAWDQIWVPDVFFRNEKKASFHEVTLPNRMMRLYPNGTVYYAAKITATLSCQMKLHKYPLDTQVCPIQFESFGHTVKANIYDWRDKAVEHDKLNLPQFELSSANKRNCQQTYATGDYPCLEVEFVLHRTIGYYLIQLYVPSVLIVILSWVAFWISIDAIPARVTIGLLTVLTMTTQSATARASLPRVSYIKAMDVWMSVCLLFVFASLLEFAVVNVFSRKEIRKKSQGLRVLSETAKDFEELLCAQALSAGALTSTVIRQRRQQQQQQQKSDRREGILDSFYDGDEQQQQQQQQQQQSVSHLLKSQASTTSTQAGAYTTYSRRQANRRREEMRQRARVIDKLARKLFPLVFILFNVVYWIGYTLW